MDEHPASESDHGAEQVYAAMLESLNRLQARERRRERTLGISKLAIAAIALVAAPFLIHRMLAVVGLLGCVAAFVVLAILQERLIQSLRYRARAIQFYERGLARLNGSWSEAGETGERFLESAHPYARDLDLFGRASVYQYLCAARTRSGEETLAHWLLEPAQCDEIGVRQVAVRELAGLLGFRERISSAGETVGRGVRPQSLSAWGESKPVLTSASTRFITATLAIAWVGAVVYWAVNGAPLVALLMTVMNFAYAHRLHPRLECAARAIEDSSSELRLLAEIMAMIEGESFVSPKLLSVQAGLKREGTQPSQAIRRLALIAELTESRHSLFMRPIDLVTFWSAQLVFAAERWQRKFGPAIREWLAAVGEMEALASLSAFAYDHPDYSFPDFELAGPLFDAEGMAHPLLASAAAVENDVALGLGRQLMILSGPNMAGKSTFIRCIGVNAVLAQCGAPVRARRLRLSPLRVAASICILDSLSGGTSRFYAEIRRIKLIADLSAGAVPVLFLFDELLSGTNSHDRYVGTKFVLQKLVEQRAIGVVSTHDLALAQIPDTMNGVAFNAHFEDRLVDGKLVFDYKLKPGVVRTSNALDLMRSIGLGVTE